MKMMLKLQHGANIKVQTLINLYYIYNDDKEVVGLVIQSTTVEDIEEEAAVITQVFVILIKKSLKSLHL